MVLAPLIRGGNRYTTLIGLEWLSLLALWIIASDRLWQGSIKAPTQDPIHDPLKDQVRLSGLSVVEIFLLLSPVWAAMLFLTPAPSALWAWLPGRDIYFQSLSTAWRPLSLVPDATATSLLASLPVMVAFLLSRTASPRLFLTLPSALTLIALLQALWGLLQVGPFKELYFGAEFSGGLIGSFANANHFANFIAMTLPLTLFMLFRAITSQQEAEAEAEGKRSQRSIFYLVGCSVVLLLMMTAVLASGSRTGAVTALLVTLLTTLHLARDLPKATQRWYIGGAGALLLAVFLILGMRKITGRFDTVQFGEDAFVRWQLASSSWRAALAFWPLGAGPGTFASVFPQFQPPGLGVSIEHAHNDYVEFLIEFGVLFLVLIGMAGWLIVRQCILLRRYARDACTPRVGRSTVRLQQCCGLGLLALLMHSWFDFNLRIPANAMLFACLLGAFLRPIHCRHDTKKRQPFFRGLGWPAYRPWSSVNKQSLSRYQDIKVSGC